MIGLGTATSIMVGQFQGAKESHLADRTTVSALHMAFVHNTAIAFLYWFIPEILISSIHNGDFESPAAVNWKQPQSNYSQVFHRHHLSRLSHYHDQGRAKGSGDTRFVMAALGGLPCILRLVLPSYILTEVLNQPVQIACLVQSPICCCLPSLRRSLPIW